MRLSSASLLAVSRITGTSEVLRSAQSASILSYIDPVTAFLLSALLLREPLSLPGIIGAVMIILSAVISET